MSDVHRLYSAPHFIVSVITRILAPPHVRAWQCHIAASSLKFAKTIARCLSAMSWAVNTCLGIASDIESTSLLCWPSSGAGARHRRQMSSLSLLTLQVWVWMKQARAGHSYHLNYLFILPLWSNCVSSLMPTSVQIWCSLIGAERPKIWGGSSQKLGRIDRVWGGRGTDRPGADRHWGGSSVSR